MVRGVETRSPRTRIVLLAVVLILAPGIVLGYLGFRSIGAIRIMRLPEIVTR